MKRLPFFLVLAGLLLAALPGHAASRKLVIAVMDKVNWHDLEAAETPTLDGLMRRAHIALLVTRTAGGTDGAGAYLTLGAGSRAAAYQESGSSPEGEAYDAPEVVAGVPAGDLYEVQTGWSRAGAGIVHLGIGRLMQQNLDPSYPLRLGLLGEELTRGGLRVACLGNADTLEHRDRDIVAFAMDAQGRVALGDVGRDLLHRDPSLPYGYTTDPDRLAAAAARAAGEADVVMVALGETSRAASVADGLPPERADALRLQALTRADRLLGAVLGRLGAGWAVLVVTPSAPAPPRGETFAPLTPVISTLFPGGPGLLTSPSTRRPGLVTNTDVAATVLSFFGLAVPADSVGRPMTALATGGDPRPALDRALARDDALEEARRQVFRAYATFATAALWLGALTLFVGGLAPAWTRAVMRGLLLGVLAVPLAALVGGALPAALSSTLIVAAVIGLTALLAVLAGAAARGRRGDAVLAGAVTAFLVIDLLAGQHLLQWSTLSYSASAAARFYGIGNEYAGIAFGAALVTAAALASRRATRWRRPALAAGLLLVAALLGWPRFGANFGMTLSAAAGLGVFCLYLWRDRPSWRDLAIIAGAVVVIGVVVVGADLLARGGSSHVGLLIAAIRTEGWSAFTDVIVRKLSMNWLLMRVSQWTDVAVAALGVFAIAAIARPAAVLQATARWRWLVPASAACFAGAAASFLLNDSGIVAAGLALCYGAASLAYLGIGEVTTEPTPAPELHEAGRR
jgi:hypothetical protein